MAERENPFTVMKHYLATLNKRIDELANKTTSIAEEVKRLPEQEASERSKLTEKFNSETAELNNRLEEISSQLGGQQTNLMQVVEPLKGQLEEIKSSSATKEDLQRMQSTLREEITPLHEQKLERSEFQEFVEKNNASMKGVFEELTGGESFANFASSQVTSRPQSIAEEAPIPTEGTEPPQPEPSPSEGFNPERRHEEKRKKKWL